MKNLLGTDFMTWYEELSKLTESLVLTEAGSHEHGKYKKAFLNLINGLYYEKDGKTIHGNSSNVHTNKSRDAGTLADIVTAINTNNETSPKVATKTLDDTTWTQAEATPEQTIKAVNKQLGYNNKRAIRTKSVIDKDGNEVNYYAIYNLTPSILHHVDGWHDHNANVQSFAYTETVGDDKKRKSTSVFKAGDELLKNYILIEADTQKNATYAHMLIHLAGIVAGAIGADNVLLGSILEAFNKQLEDKNITYTFVSNIDNMTVQHTDSLLDLSWAIAKLAEKYAETNQLNQAMSEETTEPVTPDVEVGE